MAPEGGLFGVAGVFLDEFPPILAKLLVLEKMSNSKVVDLKKFVSSIFSVGLIIFKKFAKIC